MSWEFVTGATLLAIVVCTFLAIVGYNHNDSVRKDHEFRTNCIEKGGTYIGGYSPHCVGAKQ